MKVLIVEDEPAVAGRLISLLKELAPEMAIAPVVDTVEETVHILSDQPPPELIFMDIHLADGISFEIFDLVEVKTPVIFTTAYDNYAIRAFKVNSLDYLLKPINREELQKAIKKFKELSAQNVPSPEPDLKKIANEILAEKKAGRKRFLIRYGQKLKTVTFNEAACFYTEDKTVYLHTFSNERYPLDDSLDNLDVMADRSKFFRVNRSAILNIEAIGEMETYTKGRVHIMLKKPLGLSFVSSTEKSAPFKLWLDGHYDD
jgi:two-component system, LytTR family, response regulator LytT